MPLFRSRKFWAAVALLLILIAAWIWWATRPAPPQYLTTPVTRGDLENSVLASGVLQPEKQVTVGAQVSGQVTKIAVKLGDRVKKGQLVAEIDPTLSRNSLNDAQAGLESLLSQKRAKEVALRKAEMEMQRQNQMLTEEATSRREADDARLAFQSAQADIGQLDAQIRQYQSKVETAKANLSYTRINAPIDGDVVSITTLEGQTVISTQASPTILTLADLDRLQVKAQVSEADVTRIKPGQPVYFTVLGEPDVKIYSRLESINPTPETINNAIFYNALFNVDNSARKLRISMTAQVAVVLDEARNALSIPVNALVSGEGKSGRGKGAGKDGKRAEGATPRGDTARGDGHGKDGAGKRAPGQPKQGVVRVLTADKQVEMRKVTLGLNNNVRVQVLSGLAEGEQVITGQSGDGKPSARRDARPPRMM